MRSEPVEPSSSISRGRQVLEAQHAGSDRVVDVVVDVGHAVHQPHDPPLERVGRVRPGVMQDAVAHRRGEVQTFDFLDHTK